jgi:hypothetical protein
MVVGVLLLEVIAYGPDKIRPCFSVYLVMLTRWQGKCGANIGRKASEIFQECMDSWVANWGQLMRLDASSG